MLFKRKKISSATTLGGRLKNARRRKKITLEDAEFKTHIREKYLKALEKDDLNAFPSRIYALGYARRYGEFLGFDGNKVQRDFKEEFGSSSIVSYKGKKAKVDLPRFLLTPKLVLGVIIFVLVGSIIGYIAFSVSRLSRPPEIEILAPKEDTVETSAINIEGKTLDTAVVEINGQLISVDENGYFLQKVELVSGLNVFEISSKNRLGKESRQSLKILYKPSGVNTQISN